MIEWLLLPALLREETLYQANSRTGISAKALEKDWWITLALKAIRLIPDAGKLVFKGGTSLSKGWRLIDRFSEDVDLVLDKNLFGSFEEHSKKAVTILRRKSSAYVRKELKDQINDAMLGMGVPASLFSLVTPNQTVSDQDPETIEIHYKSLLAGSKYLADKVVLEISVRSLREPFAEVEISSMLSDIFKDSHWSSGPFLCPAVMPQRTFLEKVFLLHEEFLRPSGKIRSFRMSRHLYDLERMMDTRYAIEALMDRDLFNSIAAHRKQFMRLADINYDRHSYEQIDFIPPAGQQDAFRKDYTDMQQNMIFGESVNYDTLIRRLEQLRDRFRENATGH